MLKRLDLHYRVVTLCTGDMGFASQKTYDIEVWLPGQETLSRNLILLGLRRFPGATHECALPSGRTARAPRFVHTLNGSGVAVGRALIAVLENYQNADGSITVPEALRPYMGGMRRSRKLEAATMRILITNDDGIHSPGLDLLRAHRRDAFRRCLGRRAGIRSVRRRAFAVAQRSAAAAQDRAERISR